MRTINTYLQDLETDYQTGTIDLADGLPFSQHQTIREIQFMSNSKFLSGSQDKLGREKPYFNIINGNVLIATVATDIDRKDHGFTSDNPDDDARNFIMRRISDNWMRESDFGTFQNRAGETRARYGGVLIKKATDKDKGLVLQVVQWGNVSAVDPSSIIDGVIVETHHLTPSELMEKYDTYENVEEAIKLFTDKKGKCEKIVIKEVHGVLPKYLLADDENKVSKEDNYEYCRQYHVVAVKGNKYECLYKEEEKDNPYKYRAYEVVEKRDLGRGVAEKGMWAQIEANDAILGEKEAFALGRKVLFKTTSKKLAGNVQTDVDNGHIFALDPNTDISVLNTITGNLPQFQNLVDKWHMQFDRSTAITDSLRGETPPSGQAYRLGALLTQQSASTFDYIREDMGLFYEEIWRDWVLPYLTKKYSKKTIIASDLFSTEELMKIDEKYAIASANEEAKRLMMQGKIVTPEALQMLIDQYKKHIGNSGSKRFIETEDDFFKGYEGRAVFNITGEQKNKQAVLESISNIFQTVAGNPAVLQDPMLRKIFGKILELSGANVSPLELEQVANNPAAQAQMQMQQQAQLGQAPAPAPVAPGPAPQPVNMQ